MTRKAINLTILLTVLAMLAFGAWAYPRLPEQTPSHWNAQGAVDDTLPRLWAVLLMPLMTLGIGYLLVYIPAIDPLGKNVESFRWVYHGFIAGFCVYMAYIHVLTLLAGLGVAFNMTLMLLPAMGLLFIGIGSLLEHARPSWFIGIRTPWTLSSEAVWLETHRVGAWVFRVAGALCVLAAFLPPILSIGVILVALLGAALGTVVYSYFVYRRLNQKG